MHQKINNFDWFVLVEIESKHKMVLGNFYPCKLYWITQAKLYNNIRITVGIQNLGNKKIRDGLQSFILNNMQNYENTYLMIIV